MSQASNVIVVGGGPVGAFTAWELAKLGVNVTVFEEHSEAGVPSHCAGHFSTRGLKTLGLQMLPRGVVENSFQGANFYSAKGAKFSIRLRKPVTCAVNRTLFDKFLAEKATTAGAQFFFNSRVKSLIVKKGVTVGVDVEQQNADERRSEAEIVVDCEGISSRLVRQAGLEPLNPSELVHGIEAEVENVENVVSDEVEVYLGSEYARGFYAWLIPRLDGTAKVGLAAKAGNTRELFQRLVSKHPVASKQLSRAKVLRMAFHPISLGGPIRKTYSDGFLVVGDAASQVKPTTGGGVIFGLTCARIAAETVAEAIRRKNSSSSYLQLYQSRCDSSLGFDFRTMLRARRLINSLSDGDIENAIRFSSMLRLDKALRDIDEIDLQGKTLLNALAKPSVFAGLLYFLLLSLTVNSQNSKE